MEKIIEELVKALKNFIVRDIIYIIAGAAVLLSRDYLVTERYFGNEKADLSVLNWMFLIGLSYVIGFGLQEIACIFRITTTSLSFEPKSEGFIQKLYKLYMYERWKPIKIDQDHASAVINQREKQGNGNREEIERMVCHMQIGTAIGPCGFVSGLMILIRGLCNSFCKNESFRGILHWDSGGVIILAIFILLFSACLVILSKLKVLRIKKYENELLEVLKSTKQT